MIRPPPSSPLFPSTPLFRSLLAGRAGCEEEARGRARRAAVAEGDRPEAVDRDRRPRRDAQLDRKSTRLNSSHSQTSYAVFCLKKKKTDTHGRSHSWTFAHSS